MSFYQESIKTEAAKMGHVGASSRWIEGWMRLENGYLGELSFSQFKAEIKMALACIDASTESENESLAVSYNL